MKILVCIKQVPQKDAPLKLNEAGTWIREDVSYEVNEPDAYALEEALRQKEKHGGEVVVMTGRPGAVAAGVARSAGQGRGSRDPPRRTTASRPWMRRSRAGAGRVHRRREPST